MHGMYKRIEPSCFLTHLNAMSYIFNATFDYIIGEDIYSL